VLLAVWEAVPVGVAVPVRVGDGVGVLEKEPAPAMPESATATITPLAVTLLSELKRRMTELPEARSRAGSVVPAPLNRTGALGEAPSRTEKVSQQGSVANAMKLTLSLLLEPGRVMETLHDMEL
jgi:hypothetical protein